MSKLSRLFQNKDLRKKITYTLVILVIFRILAHIPIPGVSLAQLRSFFNQNEVFGLLNLFTGGAMKNFSLVMLGVGPFITASIIIQLLTVVVPKLEELQQEGEQGKQKINQYTRYLALPLAVLQSYTMIILLKNQGIVINMSVYQLIITIVTMTAGTMLLVWLGELISENGIGNGMSLIITLGILANIPSDIAKTISVSSTSQIIGLIAIAILAVLVVAIIVFVTEGERRVPITYARRVRGHKSQGGVNTHLPIRVNIAGVIPIIFALSMMVVPTVIAKFLSQAQSENIANIAIWIEKLFQNQTFYSIGYFVLVILFTFFYTSITFQPDKIAENLQKRGGFIPSIRPGKETIKYLSSIVSKATLIGAMFLAVIAVLPFIIQSVTNITTLAIGGTGILIVVSVIIETKRQIDSQLMTQSYENY